jgi:hypothetical protein
LELAGKGGNVSNAPEQFAAIERHVDDLRHELESVVETLTRAQRPS